MKRRGTIRGSCFDLHHSDSGKSQARLGLVIAKRFARHAVLRNLIKRQVREFFRDQATLLPAEDMVIRLARPMLGLPVAKSDQRQWVRAEIQRLFGSIGSRSA
jgi:ribonuclease P protein component